MSVDVAGAQDAGLPAADIVTGEGVRLALPSAGVGSRAVAALVDLAIMVVALIVLEVIDVAVAGRADSAALAALFVTELVLVLAGYPIVMEWLTRGRTVGKIWLGLRVVRDDGGPIGFRQALVRGLAGLILEKPGLPPLFPFTTLAGVIAISNSRQEKRLGDMMAGTVVLNERVVRPLPAMPPTWVPTQLHPWLMSLDMSRMDTALVGQLRQFVARAHELTPAAQNSIGEQLRAQVLAATSPPPPALVPTPMLLTSVLAERRRRATPIAPAVPPPPVWPPTASPSRPVTPAGHAGGGPFAPPR